MYGELGSVKIEKNPDGTSKKFGFVCFKNSADAAKALSDKEKLGMYVAEYKKKDERAVEKLKKGNLNSRQAMDVKIHVKGFEPNLTDEELGQFFRSFGPVVSWTRSKFNKITGIVCYATRQDALNAITAMDQQCINGRNLQASMWQPSQARKLEMEEQRDRSQYAMIKNTKSLNQPLTLNGDFTAAIAQVAGVIMGGLGQQRPPRRFNPNYQ